MRASLNRSILAVAALEFFAILSGAYLASSRIALGQPAPFGFLHRTAAIVALLLALGICLWSSRNPAGRYLRAAMWLAFAALALGSAAGWAPPLSPARVVCHALLAHLSFALVAAAAVLSSRAWSQPAKPVVPGPWRALRPMAIWTPAAVLTQISMGALYRHQITGVMPHMLGAMVVALLTLVVSVILIQHFPNQRELKNAATALISAVLVQVCLGIAVFIMLLLGAGNIPAFAWLATGHVCVGSLTFALSVVTAMQVGRDLSPAP